MEKRGLCYLRFLLFKIRKRLTPQKSRIAYLPNDSPVDLRHHPNKSTRGRDELPKETPSLCALIVSFAENLNADCKTAASSDSESNLPARLVSDLTV